MWIYEWKHETSQSKPLPSNLPNDLHADTIHANTFYFVGRSVKSFLGKNNPTTSKEDIKIVEFPDDKTVSKVHLKFDIDTSSEVLKIVSVGSSTICNGNKVSSSHEWSLDPTSMTPKLSLILGRNLIFKFKWVSKEEKDTAVAEDVPSSEMPVIRTSAPFVQSNRRKSYKTDISSMMDFGFTPRDMKSPEDVAESSTPKPVESPKLKQSKGKLPKSKNDIMDLFDDIQVNPVDIIKSTIPKNNNDVSENSTDVFSALNKRITPPLIKEENKQISLQANNTPKEVIRKPVTIVDGSKQNTEDDLDVKKDFVMKTVTKSNKYDVDSPQIVAIRNMMSANKRSQNESYGVPSSQIRADSDIKPVVHGFVVDGSYSTAYKVDVQKGWPQRKNYKRFVKAGTNGAINISIGKGTEAGETEWAFSDDNFITVTTRFNDLGMVSNFVSKVPDPVKRNSEQTVTELKAQAQRRYTTIAQPPKEAIREKPGLFVDNDDDEPKQVEVKATIDLKKSAKIQERPTTRRYRRGKDSSNSDADSDLEEFSFSKRLKPSASPEKRVSRPIDSESIDTNRRRIMVKRDKSHTPKRVNDSSDEEFSFKG